MHTVYTVPTYDMSVRMRKPTIRGSDQARHKSTCTVIEQKKFEISDNCTFCVAKTKTLISCAVAPLLSPMHVVGFLMRVGPVHVVGFLMYAGGSGGLI